MFAIIIQYFTYLLRISLRKCVLVFNDIKNCRYKKTKKKLRETHRKKKISYPNAIICVAVFGWRFFDDFIRKRLRSVKLLLNAINLKKATLRVLYIMYVCKMGIFNHSY